MATRKNINDCHRRIYSASKAKKFSVSILLLRGEKVLFGDVKEKSEKEVWNLSGKKLLWQKFRQNRNYYKAERNSKNIFTTSVGGDFLNNIINSPYVTRSHEDIKEKKKILVNAFEKNQFE